MRPLSSPNRRLLRSAQILTGAAIVGGLIGRVQWAIIAAGLAAALALTILRNLTRAGDR